MCVSVSQKQPVAQLSRVVVTGSEVCSAEHVTGVSLDTHACSGTGGVRPFPLWSKRRQQPFCQGMFKKAIELTNHCFFNEFHVPLDSVNVIYAC